jgi:hypothetical protein
MHGLISLVRRRAGGEEGFALVIVLGVMLLVMGVTLAALATADSDTRSSGRSRDDKVAYSAAEAGLNSYLAQLGGNSSFWASCDAAAGVTQPGDAPKWQSVGGTSTARYTAELLPAQGTCDPNDPDTSMIWPDGTLRMRFTGESGTDAVGHPTAKRSIVATLKRNGFMDYLLWTDYEDQDWRVTSGLFSCDVNYVWRTFASSGSYFGPTACGLTTAPSMASWAQTNCGTQYWTAGRKNAPAYSGTINAWNSVSHTYPATDFQTWMRNAWNTYSGTSGNWSSLLCQEISFFDGDTIAGPLHTNDALRICGTQTFGRDGNDAIEAVAPDADALREDPTCAGPPVQPSPGKFITADHGALHMPPPPSNTGLKDVAAYSFTGGTVITLGSPAPHQMTVVNNGTTSVIDQPADGVIWVGNNGACPLYNPMFPVVTTGAAGQPCGDIAVSGTYNRNITIAAENDIVVTDDVIQEPSSTAVLGLIGNQFVRIAHPSTLIQRPGSPLPTDNIPLAPFPYCRNTSTATDDLELDAAILALNGSFMLDRFGCGESKGQLNLTGAVAQAHRGLVSSSNGSGYVKNYVYDTRLRYRSPPYFLDPVGAAWHVVRQVEQTPPAYDCTRSPKPAGCP